MRTGCASLTIMALGQGIFYAEVLAWTGADLVLFKLHLGTASSLD